MPQFRDCCRAVRATGSPYLAEVLFGGMLVLDSVPPSAVRPLPKADPERLHAVV